MNLVPTLLASLQKTRASRRNVKLMLQVLVLLAVIVVLFAAIFCNLMLLEGRHFTPIAAVYWVLTTMTTLGFGDIVFTTGTGQAFTLVVLSVGILFVFIIVPFTFIETVYAAWVAAHNEADAPRELPRHLKGHVIITSADPVSFALIRKLEDYNYSYALLTPEYEQALALTDQGYNVLVGSLDDPQTYRRARIEIASLVAASSPRDCVNTNAVLTVRQLAPGIPVIALAQTRTSVEILRLAGASTVLQPVEQLGRSLARRAFGGTERAHVLAGYDGLKVAEATVKGTGLAGRTIEDTNLRSAAGVTVLGAWQGGRFAPAAPDLRITARSVLVLAGSDEQLARFNALYPQPRVPDRPVIVIGGGRIGQATGRALRSLGIDYRIIEQQPDPDLPPDTTVVGDAVRRDVLLRAGISEAVTAIITTHDDDFNIYLAIYLRYLRPDLIIVSRSVQERNLATLHRAGADFVMSYASMGANAIFNLLKRGNVEMLAEGLDIFRLPVPPKLAGRKLAEVDLRRRTGCLLIAVRDEHGMQINPDPHQPLPASGEIIMLATVENEARFLAAYPLPAHAEGRSV